MPFPEYNPDTAVENLLLQALKLLWQQRLRIPPEGLSPAEDLARIDAKITGLQQVLGFSAGPEQLAQWAAARDAALPYDPASRHYTGQVSPEFAYELAGLLDPNS